MNLTKITKRNRDRYLQGFIGLEKSSILDLKNSLSEYEVSKCFDSYSIDNFFTIWKVYKTIIQPPEKKFKNEKQLPEIAETKLPECFAFEDWAKYRLWLSEGSLSAALGLAFYLSRVFKELDSTFKWLPYIDDNSRSFMGKNHPIIVSEKTWRHPVASVMFWSFEYLKKDEHFLENENSIINDCFKLNIQE